MAAQPEPTRWVTECGKWWYPTELAALSAYRPHTTVFQCRGCGGWHHGTTANRVGLALAACIGPTLIRRHQTAHDLAVAVEVHFSHVSRWARGRRPVPVGRWRPVARWLGVDLPALVAATRATVRAEAAVQKDAAVPRPMLVAEERWEWLCSTCGEDWELPTPPLVALPCPHCGGLQTWAVRNKRAELVRRWAIPGVLRLPPPVPPRRAA